MMPAMIPAMTGAMTGAVPPDTFAHIESEFEIARRLVQRVTEAGHFDRTLVYRFLPGGSGPDGRGPDRRGEVIAETRRPAAPCLLGLRLVASGLAPATVELPLTVRGHAFGVLRCLNESPGCIEPSLSEVLERYVDLAAAALERVIKPGPAMVPLSLPDTGNLLHALLTADPALLDLAGADGVAVIAESGIAACGLTPEPALLRRLAALTMARPDRMLSTDCLSDLDPAAAECRESAAGMMAVALGEQPYVVIAAFRRERVFEEIRAETEGPVKVLGHGQPPEPGVLERWRALSDRLRDSVDRLIADMATLDLPQRLDGALPAALLLLRDQSRPEPCVMACNRDYRRLFRVTVDEVIDRPPAIEVPAPGAVREIPVPIPGEAARTVVITHRPLLRRVVGGDDRTVSVLVFEDVTRNRRVEQALHAAHEQAEAAARTRSVFLASLSHRLRTPLNTIIGFSEIMRAELFGALGSPKYREYVRNIQTAGEQLLGVIGDVLDLSKIEAGHYVLEEHEIDLVQIIEEVCVQENTRAERAGVKLLLEVVARRMPTRADARALIQILLSLLSNSFKFTPAGGLVICRALALTSGGVAIEVQDTGVGIPEDHLHRVLAPFLQVRDRHLRKTTGIGLGLPLVRMLAELHGGQVIVNSRAGQGTAIRVCLPPRAC
ncbi:MAG: ATP-binding protein [Rhodospirillaceae bacterium]